MHVLRLRDKTQASSVLKHLATVAPLGTLEHCKRVRRDLATGETLVLLGPVCPGHVGQHWTALGLDVATLGDVAEARVPATEPLTRRQFDVCSQFWSACAGFRGVGRIQVGMLLTRLCFVSMSPRAVSFHEDKHLAAAINKTFFGAAALVCMHKYMLEAMSEARLVVDGSPRVGAVLVDTARGVVVARGRDARAGHPLRHAGCCLACLLTLFLLACLLAFHVRLG